MGIGKAWGKDLGTDLQGPAELCPVNMVSALDFHVAGAGFPTQETLGAVDLDVVGARMLDPGNIQNAQGSRTEFHHGCGLIIDVVSP